MSRPHRIRLTLVADVHGDVENARRAVRFHLSRKCDALLVAGDVGSRAVWPVGPEAGEAQRAQLAERGYFPFEVASDEGREFESYVADVREERSVAPERVAFVEGLIDRGRRDKAFASFARESLRSVLSALAVVRHQPVLVVLGEQDYFNAERAVEEAGAEHRAIVAAHGRCVPLAEGLAVVGLGRAVRSMPEGLPLSLVPWDSYYLTAFGTRAHSHGAPRTELSEEEMLRALAKAYRQAGGRRVVLLSHAPPFQSGADISVFGDPSENDRFRVFFVGSRSVRRFALRPETALVGCGHVHSCAGVTRVGDTVVVNPGQLRRMESPIVNLRTFRDGVGREYVPVARWDAIGCGGALVELGETVEASRFEV